MKKIYIINLFIILFSLSANNIFGLDISITHSTFQYKNTKYIELYIQVIGNTVKYREENGLKQAKVDFTVLIKQGDKIVNFDKFTLTGPKSKNIKDFIGIRRFKVKKGEYILDIVAKDVYDENNIFKYNNSFSVDLNENDICISDIQLLAKIKKSNESNNPFVKNGYYLEPVLFHYLPKGIDTLGLYLELYNLNKTKNEKYVVLTVNKGFKNDGFNTQIIKQKIDIENKTIYPVLTKMSIKGLQSGNYHLKVDLFSDKNQLLASKYTNFQRSNPVENAKSNYASTGFKNSFANKMTEDSIYYSLKAMVPLMESSNSVSINNIISSKNTKAARYFLWRYWYDKNNIDPAGAYSEYMKYAKAVDKKFRSQLGYGFETDRGYIYLKYGMPSEIITRESEPTAPPYEIWFYDRIEQDDQRRVKFIFYIPSLAHNDFVLLHSNCRGEKKNPTWFYELYSKRNDSNVRNVKQSQIESFYEELKNSFDNNAVRLWEELK